MVFKLEDTAKVEKLFENWQETLIWSCLQKVMGSIYVTDLEQPRSAVAIVGDFAFYAGEPNRELVLYKPEERKRDYLIMVPELKQRKEASGSQHPYASGNMGKSNADEQDWAQLMEECWGEHAHQAVRYAIKKESDVFERKKLRKFAASLPEEFTLKLMDEALFDWCRAQDWTQDFVAQYRDYEQYREIGLGVLVLKEGKPVAGASSYTSYREGIEIEIDTMPEYRRKGLATACAARLILECLDRGLYPSWDAQNLWSVGLAEKLGYHFDHEYVVYLRNR